VRISGDLVEEVEQGTAIAQPAGSEQRPPAFGSTHSLMRYHWPSWSADGVVAHEPSPGAFSTPPTRAGAAPRLAFTPECGVRERIMTCSSVRSERHGRETGVPFVKHIDDAVIVDGVPALAEISAQAGQSGDFIRDRLAARRTEFHV